jgi:hypothetical protein
MSFQVTGPSATSGHVDLYIPKSLISETSNLQVYLDGEISSYTSQSKSDAWLVYFTYKHSTHHITVNSTAGTVSATEPLPGHWPYITLVSVAVSLTIAMVLKKKRKVQNSKDDS